MRTPRVLACLLLAITIASLSQAKTTLISDVNVVTTRDCGVLEDQTVLISDGYIERMGQRKEIEIPEDVAHIDGSQKYLVPGLSEMHAHLPSGKGSSPFGLEDTLSLFLANGITTIRNVIGSPAHLEVRQSIQDGEVLGPRLITAGSPLDAGLGYHTVDGTTDAREQVREQASAGYDLLKILEGLGTEEMQAIAEAAAAADIEFSGHVPSDISIEEAVNLGYGTIEHLDGYMLDMANPDAELDGPAGLFGFRWAHAIEDKRLEQAVEVTAESGVWNVPTESLAYNLFEAPIKELENERPELRYVPDGVRSAWASQVKGMRQNMMEDPDEGIEYMQARRTLLESLRKAGARFLLGSDAPQWFNVPGFSIHREISRLEEAGFSNCSILRMGTRNVAEYLGIQDKAGEVKKGYVADLVLVEGNPLEKLENLRSPSGVFVRGEWIDSATIEQRLEDIADG